MLKYLPNLAYAVMAAISLNHLVHGRYAYALLNVWVLALTVIVQKQYTRIDQQAATIDAGRALTEGLRVAHQGFADLMVEKDEEIARLRGEVARQRIWMLDAEESVNSARMFMRGSR